jgi:hypothetical protein
MTPEEAARYHGAYQAMKAKGTPAEYMRYMEAKRVLAEAGVIDLTPGQRGFLDAVRRPMNTGDDA